MSSVIPGRAQARTRNLEIPGPVLSHRPGMTEERAASGKSAYHFLSTSLLYDA